MAPRLPFKKFILGFTLLEVIISLLIITITFTAFSDIINQNLKFRENKTQSNGLLNNQINALTIVVSEPNANDLDLIRVLNSQNLQKQIISQYGTFQEIELEVFLNEDSYKIKYIK